MQPSSSETASRRLAVPALREAGDASAWLVSLYVSTLSLWIGAAVFFSAGVLPVLFSSLPSSEAGGIAALIFPVYFRAGLAVGLVVCVAAALLYRSQGGRWRAALGLLAIMTFAQAWSTLSVYPEMTRIRGVDAEVARFQQLHKLSVRLNAVVLLGGVLLLGASGFLLARRRDER